MLLTTQHIRLSTGTGKARMADDPGNSSQSATIRRTQCLRAAGEVCILGRWKYFERYSEMRRVPVVRTQSTFGRRDMWGKQGHADPVGSQMIVKSAVAFAGSSLGEPASRAHHPRFYANVRLRSLSPPSSRPFLHSKKQILFQSDSLQLELTQNSAIHFV
jgi:hypothetical protein